MNDISIIGTGTMGSALARAMLRGGHRVTVWNRTRAKAEPLVRDGATLAPDPASAVAAGPVVLVCVDDYQATYSILSPPDVRPHLAGRILVQVSGGTPGEAREMERWARDSEAGFLHGEIMTYPDGVGTPEAVLFVAGAEATYRRCEHLLRSIADEPTYLGKQVGAAPAIGWAQMSVAYGAYLGALHGAQICDVEGLAVSEFASGLAAETIPTVGEAIQDLLERIRANRFDGSQATLRTNAIGAEQLLQHARDMQIDTGFPVYVSAALRKGMDAGLGDEDLSALIKILRPGTSAGSGPPLG